MAAASDRVENKDEFIEKEQVNNESHNAMNNCTKNQDIITSEIEKIQAKRKRPDHFGLSDRWRADVFSSCSDVMLISSIKFF